MYSPCLNMKMYRFLSIIFTLFAFFVLGYEVGAAGALTLARHPSTQAAQEIYSDYTEYPFLTLLLTASSEEDVTVNSIRVRFLAADGTGILSNGELQALRLYNIDRTILDGVGRTLGADGTVTFFPHYKVLKSNTFAPSVAGALTTKGNTRLFYAQVQPSDISAVGVTSNQPVTISGAEVNGESMIFKRGLPDLYIKEMIWEPSLIRMTDPALFAIGRVPLTKEEYDALRIKFTVVIGNKGTVRANLRDSTYVLYLGAVGNTVFSYKTPNDLYVSWGGELKVSFDVGQEAGLRSAAGTRTLIFEVDRGDFIEELNNENNRYQKDIFIWGFDKLQVELAPQSLKSSKILTDSNDVDLAEWRFLAVDSQYGFDLSSVTINLSGCGNPQAVKNVRLVEKNNQRVYGVYPAGFGDGLLLKFILSPYFKVSPSVFQSLVLRADIKDICKGPFQAGVVTVETSADISKIKFPVLGNSLTLERRPEPPPALAPIPEPSVITATPLMPVLEPAPVPVLVIKVFAYGKPRSSLAVEQEKAKELKQKLQLLFNRTALPIHARHWNIYVNAHVYGGYPAEAIHRSLILGGKTVHPTIPWAVWKESGDYKNNIGK